jgi:hypothetical protein
MGMFERKYWVGDKKMIERRFFINSIAADAKKFSQVVRGIGELKTLHIGDWLLFLVMIQAEFEKEMIRQS